MAMDKNKKVLGAPKKKTQGYPKQMTQGSRRNTEQGSRHNTEQGSRHEGVQGSRLEGAQGSRHETAQGSRDTVAFDSQKSRGNLSQNGKKKNQPKGLLNWDIDALEEYEDFEDLVDFEGFKTIGKKNGKDRGNRDSDLNRELGGNSNRISGKNADSQNASRKYMDSKNAQNQNADRKYANGKNAENQNADRKFMYSKFADPNTDSKFVNRKNADSKIINNKNVSNKKEYSKFNPSKSENTNNGNTKNGNTKGENHNNQLGKRIQSTNNCPVVKKCGGCQLIHLEYEKQLALKQKQVDDLLKKYAKVEPIIGMKNPLHYRNKVHAVFDHDRKGNPISGVYEAGTHRVVPVESCLIEDKKADEIIGTIRGMLKSFKIKTYDEDTGFGLLRHVLIRKGFKSGEIMVVLVLSSPIFPSKNNFVKALLKQHPEITTIVLNVNDKSTSMVLGEKEQVIYGKGYIEDSLCGKTFRISPKSFYQVNPVQTEILYNKAIELAGLSGNETVIDAYCGIGTIGLIASSHVKKVIGVELNQDAVRDAVMNAKRNQVSNVDFYNKDAGEFMSQMAEQNETVDVVFMDPPRAGSDEKFLDSLCAMKPGKVVYISCNPVTLERDLGYLVKKKYKVERIVPVDMFPGTEHVESVILLHRKNI